ncbi:MAG: hypothetical protein BWY30_00365 [Tenericutes bacterium ADurb.Bin239]|nr:MAG: hypothetical protein BWY30_00365 [Tenericutes bacterium ADurb.Bin239]
MKIYDLLRENRRPHLITPSREYLFFQEHEALLTQVPEFLPFINSKDDFDLICANILQSSLLNGEALSKYWASNPNGNNELPVKPLFTFNNVPIYCPLFSVSNNILIANNLGNKLTLIHDTIDIFETYNFALFESQLTSLMLVGQDAHTRAYYHYDFHAIYIVNDQGRLDVKICLFDKHIKRPDFRNVIERVKPVLEAYYAGNRIGFINALFEGKLISHKMYNKYINNLKRRKIIT